MKYKLSKDDSFLKRLSSVKYLSNLLYFKIDTYIREVTNDLSKNLLSATWRTRQASCYALSDLLRSGRGMQGKDKNIFIKYFAIILYKMEDL